MIVDRAWTFLGSANWDPRSLVLNFELNVECYDPTLADKLIHLVEARRELAEEVHLSEIRERSIFLKLRDNLARLFSPYL